MGGPAWSTKFFEGYKERCALLSFGGNLKLVSFPDLYSQLLHHLPEREKGSSGCL